MFRALLLLTLLSIGSLAYAAPRGAADKMNGDRHTVVRVPFIRVEHSKTISVPKKQTVEHYFDSSARGKHCRGQECEPVAAAPKESHPTGVIAGLVAATVMGAYQLRKRLR